MLPAGPRHVSPPQRQRFPETKTRVELSQDEQKRALTFAPGRLAQAAQISSIFDGANLSAEFGIRSAALGPRLATKNPAELGYRVWITLAQQFEVSRVCQDGIQVVEVGPAGLRTTSCFLDLDTLVSSRIACGDLIETARPEVSREPAEGNASSTDNGSGLREGQCPWAFAWRELPLHDTLDGLEAGLVDVAIAALTVTEERERRIDFSHSYHTGGLAAAWRDERRTSWIEALRDVAWWDFLRVVGSLALVLLAAGAAVWLFERRANPEQFGGGTFLRGVGAGFWWSAVTMTTVGYGDKAPRTLGGRVVAILWMFTSVIVIAGFTGSIAAAVAVRQLDTDLLRDRALSELRVGVLAESSGAEYVAAQGARPLEFANLADALDALAGGKLDVVVHDATILSYEVRRVRDVRLEVSSEALVRDDYGLGLPNGSALREPINLSLLSVLRRPAWREVRKRYLGE